MTDALQIVGFILMSRQSPARSPAWVGIGAQRSGTSWFADLLLTHPEVCLSPGQGSSLAGRKELHFFDRLEMGMKPARFVSRYHNQFAGCPGTHPGEFTPAYMRLPWTAVRLRQAVSPDTLLICLLRDPIDRFYSGLRWSCVVAGKNGNPKPEELAWSRLAGSEAIWGGMYATQLQVWRKLFDRLLVLQFEAAVENPAAAVGAAWQAMGLEPIPLPEPLPKPSMVTTQQQSFGKSPRLDEALHAIYRSEVDALAELKYINRDLWISMNRAHHTSN